MIKFADTWALQLVLLILVPLPIICAGENASSFGKPCNSDRECDIEKSMFCSENGQCDCPKPTSMTYDNITEQCLIMAGKECYPDYRFSRRSRSDSKKQYMYLLSECVGNSRCKRKTYSEVCTCDPDHFQTTSGVCLPKPGLSELCNDSFPCTTQVKLDDSFYYQSTLKCLNGSCVCDSPQSQKLRDANDKQYCAKTLGMACTYMNSEICIPGATCNPSSNTCQCNGASHFETPEKTCERQKTYNKSCTDNRQCNFSTDKLNCSLRTQTCQCSDIRLLDTETKQCRLKVNSPCNSSTDNVCVPNANCVYSKVNPSKCKCDDTTWSSLKLNDYCYIKEGERCYGDLNWPITVKTCLPNLLCRDGICSCPYKGQQVYNYSLEKCVSYISGPCGQDDDCHDPQAECAQKSPRNAKQCHCKRGYVAVGQRCQIAFGGECSHQVRHFACDSVASLECSSRKLCECPDLQIYDNAKRKCNGLVGALCNSSKAENENDFCIPGAVCEPFRNLNKTLGVCTCAPGMVMQEGRTCL